MRNVFYSEGTKDDMDKHIGVLDGIRAISILFIVWYHLWQQNWLTPYIDFNSSLTRYLGVVDIPLALIVRNGFIFVEMMIFLSAFCNFYPYVRSMINGEKWPSLKEFYIKRASRIAPSYLLAVIVSFVVELISGAYSADAGFIWKDIVSHLTFTSGLFKSTYIASKLNPVLWTVELEVLFYLIMPFIAWAFKKLPTITYTVMIFMGIISVNFILFNRYGQERALVNHPVTFFGVYANGLLCCLIYVLIKNRTNTENFFSYAVGTVLAITSAVFLIYIVRIMSQAEDLSVIQLKMRLVLSYANGAFILGTAFSHPILKKVFDNPVAKYICGISYNLYIWHQVLFFRLVHHHIPPYQGVDNPAWSGNKSWQVWYTIIALFVAFGVAFAATYFFEKPVRECLLRLFDGNKKRKKTGKNMESVE